MKRMMVRVATAVLGTLTYVLIGMALASAG